MAKPDLSAYQSFDDITSRLDEIVSQVKKKDMSIEHSLDLFDEAIALGSKAVDLVDVSPVSEAERQNGSATSDGSAAAQDAKDVQGNVSDSGTSA